MAETQTLWNPRTGQPISINLSQPNATQIVASYYQQGYLGSPPANAPVDNS